MPTPIPLPPVVTRDAALCVYAVLDGLPGVEVIAGVDWYTQVTMRSNPLRTKGIGSGFGVGVGRA